VFEDYSIMNVGQGEKVALMDATTGAGYDIFKGIDGVSVAGNKITVEGGAFGYADPSHYASLSMLRTEFAAAKKIAKARKTEIGAKNEEDLIKGVEVGFNIAVNWINRLYREA
jgi:alpha-L-rhamnosidase